MKFFRLYSESKAHFIWKLMSSDLIFCLYNSSFSGSIHKDYRFITWLFRCVVTVKSHHTVRFIEQL